jgi:phosphatidylserine decarboxylase
MLTGSLKENSQWFIKGKFFHLDELLGMRNKQWINLFNNGDIAIFRLTPDKYHYNHTPVAGTVIDYYEIDGPSHSCNPGAVVQMAQPYSKNKRTVTIIDTDVEQGTGVGKVAMIEVTALIIGISLLTIIIMTLCLLTICMPSSKILAQILDEAR